MKSPTIMIQGTASNVGKSLVVAGLCRYFAQQGLKVAPFKAQNMALNSYVTPDGFEIGRAQAIQADAARQPCSVHMNPILLKPEGEKRCQIVIEGKAINSMSAKDYHNMKPKVRELVISNLDYLRNTHDLVIIEGAGSPAEVNLKQHDIVNMFVAKSVNAPVLLVGDIDRGGVFASFVGTLELLDEDERELVKGFIINKFRGDPDLLMDGIHFLEEKTARRSFGILPMIKDLRFAEEDSLSLEDRPNNLSYSPQKLDIGIIKLPRLSNYDEFDSLEHDSDIHLAYITNPQEVLDADLIILPGTKNTIDDLLWLKKLDLDQAIKARIEKTLPVIAICGGCQMLGHYIKDPDLIESSVAEIKGIGIFEYETTMHSHKTCSQTKYELNRAVFGLPKGLKVNGYEIHVGRINHSSSDHSAFKVLSRNNASINFESDGMIDHNVLSTLAHGLFDNDHFRIGLLNFLRMRKDLPLRQSEIFKSRDEEYNRIAMHIKNSLDMHKLHQLVEGYQ